MWRVFKPRVISEPLQPTSRTRRYHKPWKQINYVVPGDSGQIEAFGPPSGGAADHSSVFQDEDTLPLGGTAERRACERFRDATFAIYSQEAADRQFATQSGLDTTVSQLRADLSQANDALAQARREIDQLGRRLRRLEEAQKAQERTSP